MTFITFITRDTLSFFAFAVLLAFISCGDSSQDPSEGSSNQTQPAPPAQGGHSSTRLQVKPGEIPRASGGNTIEECFSMRAGLSGKTVTVRGRVVKFTPEVMGSNWIHLQDGSGQPGTNDLTVTTKARAEVGRIVTATGRLTYDKNLGAGYVYAAILEDAQITAE